MYERRIKDVWKMYERRMKDVSKMYERRMKDVSKMYERHMKDVWKTYEQKTKTNRKRSENRKTSGNKCKTKKMNRKWTGNEQKTKYERKTIGEPSENWRTIDNKPNERYWRTHNIEKHKQETNRRQKMNGRQSDNNQKIGERIDDEQKVKWPKDDCQDDNRCQCSSKQTHNQTWVWVKHVGGEMNKQTLRERMREREREREKRDKKMRKQTERIESERVGASTKLHAFVPVSTVVATDTCPCPLTLKEPCWSCTFDNSCIYILARLERNE